MSAVCSRRNAAALVACALLALLALVAASSASGAAAAKCRTSQLSAKVGQGSGAAGTIVFSVVLRSRGATCTLKGYAKLPSSTRRACCRPTSSTAGSPSSGGR